MTDLDKGKASPATFMDPPGAKRSRKRTRKVKPAGTPGHQAAVAANSAMVPASPDGVGHAVVPGICHHGDVDTPDLGKRAPLGVPSANPLGRALDLATKAVEQGGLIGHPPNTPGAAQMSSGASTYGNPHDCDNFDHLRESASLGRGQGHMDDSGNAGGNASQPGGTNRQLAYMHPNMRQASPDVQPFGRAGAPPKATFIGQAGFHSQFSETDTPPGADRGQPRLQTYDFAVQTGHVSGQSVSVDYHPDDRPVAFAPARGSATPPAPGHSLRDPESHAVSNKEARDIIRKAMFGR